MLFWLIEIRKRKKITQGELADKIGMSRQAISTIETGKNRPSINAAKAIAKALNFDWHIFYDDNTPSVVNLLGVVQRGMNKRSKKRLTK